MIISLTDNAEGRTARASEHYFLYFCPQIIEWTNRQTEMDSNWPHMARFICPERLKCKSIMTSRSSSTRFVGKCVRRPIYSPLNSLQFICVAAQQLGNLFVARNNLSIDRMVNMEFMEMSFFFHSFCSFVQVIQFEVLHGSIVFKRLMFFVCVPVWLSILMACLMDLYQMVCDSWQMVTLIGVPCQSAANDAGAQRNLSGSRIDLSIEIVHFVVA